VPDEGKQVAVVLFWRQIGVEIFLLAGAFPGGSSVTLSISAIQPFAATQTHESDRQEVRIPIEPLPRTKLNDG
jgi:hypothetical protein